MIIDKFYLGYRTAHEIAAIAAKGKVTQAVEDNTVFIALHGLQNMWMMADDQRRTCIDGSPPQ